MVRVHRYKMVGSADIVVTLVMVVLFLRAKGGAKCLDYYHMYLFFAFRSAAE